MRSTRDTTTNTVLQILRPTVSTVREKQAGIRQQVRHVLWTLKLTQLPALKKRCCANLMGRRVLLEATGPDPRSPLPTAAPGRGGTAGIRNGVYPSWHMRTGKLSVPVREFLNRPVTALEKVAAPPPKIQQLL